MSPVAIRIWHLRVWFCNFYRDACYKVCSDAVTREINPQMASPALCDQTNRAPREKPPLSLVPGKEISGSRSGLISRSGKKRYFETIYVILTAAALSWITLMQRFQRADWISSAIVFVQIFPQMQAKDLFTICLPPSRFLSRRAI